MTLPAIFQGVYDPLAMYELATLARLNYNPTDALWQFVGNGLRTHLQRIELSPTGALGFPRTNILSLSDRNIIVIAGSTDITSWANNSLNLATSNLAGNPNIWVATGFWTQAQALMAQLRANNVDLTKPTILVGHSLGGAIAACLAAQWAAAGGGSQLVTVSFGCPMVGGRGFYSTMAGLYCRCVYNGDLVTQIPQNGLTITLSGGVMVPFLSGYVQGGTMLWINARTGTVTRQEGGDLSGMDMAMYTLEETNFVPGQPFGSAYNIPTMARDHLIWNYVKFWRGKVSDAPRYVLESFDSANTTYNGVTGDTWPTLGFLLDGASLEKDPLPEDPVELLPYPAASPVYDPAAPVVIPPHPPTAPQIRERAYRARRNV